MPSVSLTVNGRAVTQEVENRTLLVELLRETRDPYWDVLIEHGVEPDGPIIDVSRRPGTGLSYR